MTRPTNMARVLDRMRREPDPDDDYIDWPDDVATLRAKVPECATLKDGEIEALYGSFSDGEYCAGWMCDPGERVDAFRAWLHTESASWRL